MYIYNKLFSGVFVIAGHFSPSQIINTTFKKISYLSPSSSGAVASFPSINYLSVLIDRCIFSQCYSSNCGAFIHHNLSLIRITRSRFEKNTGMYTLDICFYLYCRHFLLNESFILSSCSTSQLSPPVGRVRCNDFTFQELLDNCSADVVRFFENIICNVLISLDCLDLCFLSFVSFLCYFILFLFYFIYLQEWCYKSKNPLKCESFCVRYFCSSIYLFVCFVYFCIDMKTDVFLCALKGMKIGVDKPPQTSYALKRFSLLSLSFFLIN
jgi:hypothetical protein